MVGGWVESFETQCRVWLTCRFMETWMMIWSLVCVVVTAFTCATFLVDTDRFRSVLIAADNYI